MEKDLSLVGIYEEAKAMPSPAMELVNRIAKAVNRKPNTVRTWMTRPPVIPDLNVQRIVSEMLGAPVEVLFPNAYNNGNGE